MAVLTTEDVNRRLMMKIIGHFGGNVEHISSKTAMCRHFNRMIMLVRWKFLRYCQRKRCNELALDGFDHNLKYATIGMWMDEPYMKMYNAGGDYVILAQLSVERMKELYKYIKELEK